MGIGIGRSSGCLCSHTTIEKIVIKEIPKGNPDPTQFVILRQQTMGDYIIVEILYPNCTNFEGKKILLFKGFSYEQIHSAKFIDTHFFDKHNDHPSPIARFEPTEFGWLLAVKVCYYLNLTSKPEK